MIFAGILAGGKGERIKSQLPKQFISVCGSPILYYSLDKFCNIDKVGMTIVSCHKEYMDVARLITKSVKEPEKIVVIEGGQTRHQSLVNVINHIKKLGFNNGDKILLHEAARPLIDTQLILEHINNLASFEATNTLFRAVDTMMVSGDGQFVEEVPPKHHIYHGQTPQGYDLNKLLYVLENEITIDDLGGEVDLCGIYLRNKRKVKIINGNEKLFKVTYEKDVELLKYYLENEWGQR